MIDYKFLKSTSFNLPNCPGTFDYEPTDTLKNLRKIRKKHPELDRPVKYTLNSQGYRCPEFDTIDWNNSIVTLGCSNTYGIGVSDDETYSSILESILDYPVINLGMGGSSIWHTVYTARVIAKLNPKKVILQVPQFSRFTIFDSDNFHFTNVGPWCKGIERHMIVHYGREHNAKVYQDFAVDYIDKLLPNGLSYIFTYTSFEEFNKIKEIDRARDNMHPGPATHEQTAQIIADTIRSV